MQLPLLDICWFYIDICELTKTQTIPVHKGPRPTQGVWRWGQDWAFWAVQVQDWQMWHPKIMGCEDVKSMFSPTYQVRVSRLYQSCMLPTSSSTSPLGPRPQSPAPELSGHCQTSTAKARSQWEVWDLNRECKTSHRMSDRIPDKNFRICVR